MSGAVWPDLAGRIEGQVHKLPIRVYYEDTDFSGIVYHANYLRFAERGRSDFCGSPEFITPICLMAMIRSPLPYTG